MEIEVLKNRAIQIRDEKQRAANTAYRVGSLLLDMLDNLNDLFGIDENGDVYVKNNRNFYSFGTLGSLGPASSSSGESGPDSGSGFNEAAMWNALAASGSDKINASHLPLGSGLTVVNGLITASVGGGGSVTSVGLTVPTGLVVSNSPITSAGNIAVSLATGYVIPQESRFTAIERITSLFDIDSNGDVYVKNNRNFYSYGTVGSLGAATSDTSYVFDWSELTTADASKVIDISHIPSIPYSKITGAPSVAQQTVTLVSGTNNGTLKLTVGTGVTDNIAVKGLAAAAYKGVVTALDTSDKLPTSNAVKTALTPIERITSLFDIDSNGDVYVKDNRNFYSYGTVGSLGAATSGSSNGFDWSELTTADASKVIDISHIPSIPYSKITGAPSVALQTVTLVSGTNNGTLKLTVGSGVTDNIAVKGLAAAAYKNVVTTLDTSANLPTANAVKSAISAIERITSLFDIDSNGDVYVKNNRNFYSYGTVGSLGAASSSESSGFSWSELTTADASKVINISHIPSIPYSKITGAPTVAQQTVTLASGTNNGTLKLTVGSGVTDNIAVKGLAAAAYKGVVTTLDTSANLPTANAVITALAGYLPATKNANGTYTVDLTKVIFTGTIVSEEDVVIYGTSSSSGGSGGSTTIIDNLTSTATDAALSANMGRYLKSLIDNIDVSQLDLSSYLPKSGGTMSGVLTMKANQYADARDGALNMNNSDIYGANSVYFADAANTQQEGLHWYRGTDTVDTLRIYNGSILFAPNRTLGSTATEYTVLHTGNISSNIPNLDASKITSGTFDAARIPTLTAAKIPDIDAINGFSTHIYDAALSRTANTVLAAPNGSAGAAKFRALVAADIPNLAASKITSGTFDVARIPTNISITGSAATASKLSTVSKTAWGQTYWTSGGVPTNISGNMTSVGSITADYYKLNNTAANPYLQFMHTYSGKSYNFYVQAYQGSLWLGQGTTNGIRLTASGDMQLLHTARGFWGVDSTGFHYPFIYDNGENIWIGAQATAAQHHRGQTFISAGYNGTSGNSTIRICVPNASNDGGTNYYALHSGNYSDYLDSRYVKKAGDTMTGNLNFDANSRGVVCNNGTYSMKFQIGSGGSNRGIWDDNANEWTIYKNANNYTVLGKSYNVGIGTDSPTQKLHVSGNILATGDVLMYSDRRFKTNIRKLEYRGDLIPYSYVKDGKADIGFIAQEVGALYPELVHADDSPQHIQSLNYNGVLAVLYAGFLRLKHDFEAYKQSKGD